MSSDSDRSVIPSDGATTTPLAAGEEFRTSWVRTERFVSATATWYSDQPGTVVFQHSTDGSTVGVEDEHEVGIGDGTITTPVKASWIRLCFRATSRPQAVFRFQSLFNPVAIQADETNGALKFHGTDGSETFVSHTHRLPVELSVSTKSTLDQLLDEIKKTNQILNMIFEVEC